jgi:hypothetical protein
MNFLKQFDPRLVLGVLLIASGALLLLENFGLIHGGLSILWTVVMGLAGVAFIATFVNDRERWWALIPGIILLTLTAMAIFGLVASELADRWSGPVFLGGVALAFFAVYVARHNFWWALIPGGVMTTLAVVAWVGESDLVPEAQVGGIFFLGLAATFGLLWLLTRMRWPLFPAIALLIVGALVSTPFALWLNIALPLILIGIGVFWLVRAFWRRA